MIVASLVNVTSTAVALSWSTPTQPNGLVTYSLVVVSARYANESAAAFDYSLVLRTTALLVCSN